MTNTTLYKKILAIFSFFTISFLYSVEYSFELSKEEVAKGEPFYASFNISGDDANLKILKRDFSTDKIEIRYFATEQHTNIVNFTTTKKQILKYEVVIYKAGQIILPKIEIEINGKKISSPDMNVFVRDEDYTPSQNQIDNFFGNGSLFDDFFSSSPIKRFRRPRPSELFIKFATTKNEIYVGEEIIGYYVLYNREPEVPNFQRDVSSFINFPFFKIDSLENIKIELPNKQLYEGEEFYTFAYDKTFALTPLKNGTFSLGKIKFMISGTPNFYFQEYSLMAKESEIKVLPLPIKNKPRHFQGGIGNFSLHIKAKDDKAYIGEPLFIKIILEGEGSLESVKDPLDNYCKKEPEDCINFNYNLYNVSKKKNFKELTKGNFGFYSKVEYEYGITFKKTGVSSIFHFIISFFNPKNANYETLEESLEEITILPARKEIELNQSFINPKTNNSVEYIARFIFLFILGILFLLFGKKYLFSTNKNIQSLVDEFSDWIGAKRGLILKNFLISKQISSLDIDHILTLLKEEPNFLENFEDLNKEQQKSILIIFKKLKKEKIYDKTD